MATSNFYESGNHGLNVVDDYEGAFEDTLDNIDNMLDDRYTTRDTRIDTPRSFDIGMAVEVSRGDKVVAILEFCTGYYEAGNVNVYTDEALLDHYDREECTFNKRDIARVVKAVKMNTTQYAKAYQFSNGETGYVQV